MDAILELGTGEALVSFLDEKGAPSIVQKAKMLFPLGQIGAITPEQRGQLIQRSRLYGIYERNFDRESAYEMITEKVQADKKREEELKREQEKIKEEEMLRKERERIERDRERERNRGYGTRSESRGRSSLDRAIGSAATSIGRSVGTQIVSGILGAIFKR